MLLLLLALLLPPGAPEVPNFRSLTLSGGPTGETRGGWAAQPHVALAEIQPGASGEPLIPEEFEPPAAPSGSGHVPAMLSAPNVSRQDRSRPRSHVPPKSHRPAGTHGLDARVKVLLWQVDPATHTAEAPRGLWAALLRLVRLASSLGMPWPDHGYESFRRQHIDSPDSWDNTDPTEYCNEMMPDRINRPTPPENSKKPPCKRTNTFIHAPEEEIRAVCQPEGGTHKTDNLFLSKEPFKLTVCTKSSDREPACAYEGERTTARILLGCERYPVHFEPQTEEEPIAPGQSQP